MLESDVERMLAARAEAVAYYGRPRAELAEKRVRTEAFRQLMDDAARRLRVPTGDRCERSPRQDLHSQIERPTEGVPMTMVPPPDDATRAAPRARWQHRDAAVLGAEIDHLRLYGITRADIANRLDCSIDSVNKWVKAHPEPRESWEVSA